MTTNPAVKRIGVQNVLNRIKALDDFCNLPIISVGSGDGSLEILYDNIYSRNIICIDPDPQSYFQWDKHFRIYKPPKERYVENYIKKHPDIIEHCVLLLNWCLPNDSTYDWEAICDLKPCGVASIYETFMGENGAAGGEQFYYKFIRGHPDYVNVHTVSAPSSDGMNVKMSLHVTQQLADAGNLEPFVAFPTKLVSMYSLKE